MSSSASVRYRLRQVRPPRTPLWLTEQQQQVTGNVERRLRVLAGPGTGKTTTLVEAVAERISARAIPPEQILVLAFSRRAADDLSDRIARRLELTTREPIVRTLHSYAYSVVRRQAAAAGEPSPRLLPADESDRMVRELLAGHRTDGGGLWPDFVTGALSCTAFASELRETLLRAAGQGVSPRRMIELGRRHRRPEWVAIGRFAREYQEVTDLRQGVSGFGVALDQAELTSAALGVLGTEEVLAREQQRIRRVFVDEYQDVDAAQARLISMLAAGADELIVFGDPDQAIYAFRGSESTALRNVEVDETVALAVSRRLPPAILAATRRVAASLPGPGRHRKLSPADGSPAVGDVDVRVFPTAAIQASYLADALRRAHLLEGVPWSSMAVLLRSPTAGQATIARAFALAGVPLLLAGKEPVSTDPLVAALLTVLECGLNPAALTGPLAAELLCSPVGGMDAVGLRRVRRALRTAYPGEGSSADLLAAGLAGAPIPDVVPRDLLRPLTMVRKLLTLSRAGAAGPVAEQLLWQLWQASGLEPTLVAAVERGGPGAQRADRSLDAVLALFAIASDLARRVPLAGVDAFLGQVRGSYLPGTPDVQRSSDAVALLSAHAAKGLEWDVVAIAGVQEGAWPDLRARGSVLGGRELLDLADGLPAGTPVSGMLAEERRLFYVAATRARRRLICTAVANQDSIPSRFLQELSGKEQDSAAVADPGGGRAAGHRRELNLPGLVADLRRAVVDPRTAAQDAAAAARHLAELAAAGVPGADPDDWYGLAPRSTEQPAVPAGAQVRVSPALIESVSSCALRAVLERRGGGGEPGPAQLEGIVVHAMAHGLANGVPEDELHAEIEHFLSEQDQLPPWQLNRTRRALRSMLAAAQQWLRDNHPPRAMLGSELEMDLLLPPAAETATAAAAAAVARVDAAAPVHAAAPVAVSDPAAGDPADSLPVRLVGRVDWLSRRPDGTVVITDFKTGASVPSRAEAQANPQLAAYQVGLSLGAFAGSAPGDSSPAPGAHPAPCGGAELVYLRGGKPKVLQQDRLSEEATTAWLGTIRTAAAHLASATAWAQENARCERCPVRTSCPLQNEGRQVTR